MARNSESGGSSRNQGGRGSQGSGGGKQAAGGASGSSRSQSSGSMSVREAGHKGGQRVSELVEKGKQRE